MQQLKDKLSEVEASFSSAFIQEGCCHRKDAVFYFEVCLTECSVSWGCWKIIRDTKRCLQVVSDVKVIERWFFCCKITCKAQSAASAGAAAQQYQEEIENLRAEAAQVRLTFIAYLN